MTFAMEAYVSYDKCLPIHYLPENGDLTKTTCMKFETTFSSVVYAQTSISASIETHQTPY